METAGYMLTLFVILVLNTSQFQVTKATKCPTENDKKCQSFWHQLFMYPGQNLREGLKCLRYDGNITSNQAFGKTSIPQKIYVDMPSVDIIELNENEEFGVWRFRTQFTWYDERLKWPIECQKGVEGDTDFVKSALLDLLWNPTSVLQDITGTFDPKYQNTIYINQNGKIVAIYTSEEKIPANFDFTWFPFDTQTLVVPQVLDFTNDKWSFLYSNFNSTNILISDWKVTPSYKNPIRAAVPHPATGKLVNVTLATTEYTFTRIVGNHFFEIFIPSMMLNLASAASVFIPPHRVPGRMGVCITTFLTLITLFNGARNHWTTTTHMRAIDVWVVLCYIGIFSSLMEYCGILYLTEDSESKNGNYKKVVTEENHRIIESGENNSAANPTELQNTRLVLANNIEKIARILFPVYNIFFPIIYFIVCLL